MAEKKEVTVDRDLLQKNLSTMHAAYMQTIDELHSKLLVDATDAAFNGEEFNPDGIELVIKRCKDCEEDSEKSDKPEIKVAKVSDKFIKDLMGVMSETVKNKEPSMENLENLVSSLEELFKKKK